MKRGPTQRQISQILFFSVRISFVRGFFVMCKCPPFSSFPGYIGINLFDRTRFHSPRRCTAHKHVSCLKSCFMHSWDARELRKFETYNQSALHLARVNVTHQHSLVLHRSWGLITDITSHNPETELYIMGPTHSHTHKLTHVGLLGIWQPRYLHKCDDVSK